MEREVEILPGNLTPEEWERNKRRLALFQQWDEEDTANHERDEESLLNLMKALEEDHDSSRRLFGNMSQADRATG